jgi:hypothetical protein
MRGCGIVIFGCEDGVFGLNFSLLSFDAWKPSVRWRRKHEGVWYQKKGKNYIFIDLPDY